MALADLAACTRIVQTTKPTVFSPSTQTSSEIDVRGYYEALIIVNIGTMVADGTLNVSVKSADASGGTFDTTVATFTEQDQAVGDPSDSVVVGRILCNGTEPFWKTVAVVAEANVAFSVTVLLIPYNTGDSDNTTMDFAV